MAECKVKSLRASWSDWYLVWPSGGCGSGSSTIQLPVKFTLELAEGSTKADCIFGQEKRGRSATGSSEEVFMHFVADGELGARYWWDGEKLSNAGKGDWNSAGTVATFEDAPGFYQAAGGLSLFMGAATWKSGYFDFRTFVNDRASGKTIKEINWSMRIDIPTPGKGGFWWSFSDQK